MCFKQEPIFTLGVKVLKLGYQLKYLCSIISSTENDFNVRLVKALNATDRLSTLWKYELDKLNQNFLWWLYGCFTITGH